MNPRSRKIIAYAKLKELRPVWVFFAFGVFYIAAGWRALGGPIAVVVASTFIAYLIYLIWTGIRLAKINFALKIERNQNSAIIAGFSEGVIAYDQNFTIISMNQAAEAITEVRKEAVIGKVVSPEWASDPSYRALAQIMFPSLAPIAIKKTLTGYPQRVDITFQEPREMHLEIITNQIFDESGKLAGFLKVIRDRSREVALLKSKSEFISVAAHQMRTPLTGIRWALDAMRRGDLGPMQPDQTKIVEQTFATIEKLVKLIDDLLNVAKIEEGKFGYVFERADPAALIREALEIMYAAAESRGVRLVFFPPSEEIPLLLVDRKKISLALLNLIDNGIKYNIKNGEVRLKIQKLADRPYIQVSVEDTGIGLSENELQRVFTKFFRGEEAVKMETEGSGLGLYIARNIIRRHGGDIWVKSAPKRGTTFFFILPTDETLIPPMEIPAMEAI